MPNQDNKSTIRADTEDRVTVTLKITDDMQPADGQSAIRAEATVTDNDQTPPEGEYEVHFEIREGGTARFTDSGKVRTQGANDENGIVTKYIIDKVAEKGTVRAYVILANAEKPGDQAHFEFVPDTEDRINVTLKITDDMQPADGQSAIRAEATVTDNDQTPPEGKYEVYFEIREGDTARFTDSGTVRTQGANDENGIVSKYFIDKVAETGMVVAYVILASEEELGDQAHFEFVAMAPGMGGDKQRA